MNLAFRRGGGERSRVTVNAGVKAASGEVDGRDALETAQGRGLEEWGVPLFLDESDCRHWDIIRVMGLMC